jgi:hypothetical protein
VCGNKVETAIYNSVTINSYTKLKEKVLNRKIQERTCKSCNQKFTIDEPLLYHDESNNFTLYYHPEKSNSSKKEIKKIFYESLNDLPKEHTELVEGTKPEVVFGWENFIKKIKKRDLQYFSN